MANTAGAPTSTAPVQVLKFCKDCANYRENRVGHQPLCETKLNVINLVTGEQSYHTAYAERMRHDTNPCGPEARLFIPLTRWQRFRRITGKINRFNAAMLALFLAGMAAFIFA